MARFPLSPRAQAYGALVLTAALWGSSAVTARGLLDTLSPAWLSALRWVVVLVALVPFVWRDRAAIAGAFRATSAPWPCSRWSDSRRRPT
jgi:drug/metabolite transporter (DMT)-like permease